MRSTSIPSESEAALSTLDRIDMEVAALLWPPFNGSLIGPVKARRLRHSEIAECGEFSLIETFFDQVAAKERVSQGDIVGYSKIQHAILRKSLVSPTYDEILKVFGQYENLESIKERIKAFQLEVDEEPEGPKKSRMRKELVEMQAHFYTILPGDFVGFIMAHALSIGITDIKSVGEELLIECANLAKLNHNRPSDNVGGAFTEFNRADIDKRAWGLWYEKNKEQDANRRRNSHR